MAAIEGLGFGPVGFDGRGAAPLTESCPANELRAVQKLLWEDISERLPAAERDEVKRVIGEYIIEGNQQLFDEATALAEIVGDVRLKIDEFAKRRQSVLLQTPQRSMVESGISMLLDNIHRAVSGYTSGLDPRGSVEALVAPGQKERSLYQYMATVQSASRSGPGSARPSTPRTPPSRPLSSCGSRPSTAGTGASACSVDSTQVLETVQPKLNAFEIDSVTTYLRDVLRTEHDSLMEDIEYLHQCLEGEAELQAIASKAPPPVQELLEYSAKLQNTWIKEDQKKEHVEKVRHMLEAADSCGRNSAGRLRTMVSVARQDDPESAFPRPLAAAEKGRDATSPSSNAVKTPPGRDRGLSDIRTRGSSSSQRQTRGLAPATASGRALSGRTREKIGTTDRKPQPSRLESTSSAAIPAALRKAPNRVLKTSKAPLQSPRSMEAAQQTALPSARGKPALSSLGTK
mmetsp:Transcript_128/g.460  ORF Transcript_128/g.460 Transcript_128/m.460 type:complete len:459 (-) Transcript_128:163-1539(-)|eukprot:CAMPEP_0117658682 /NCGR_PEP_ID=MMETSP0804-20121206/5993_1 /TAXON_ID=1074897 /ORGANISM="Tetraselmis astigmatica, Strain CCMP880" /LENGTH=458 /DNA_ID=CAMNT_0005465217 /DNA_START=24 /DNA_END=1400 /DNA_ORIENTATION=+